jgi:apolipoprotein D and lipocalin family protein
MNALQFGAITLFGLALAACAPVRPIPTVASVDLKRFMGDWYVIASIPTFIETEAYNAVESYRLGADGTVETTFRFNQGGLAGPLKTYRPRGFVTDRTSNAVWGMQFIWPIRAEYRIVYLSADYGQTIIGRSRRDYAWIMARSPSIPEADFERHVAFLKAAGYDVGKLRRVPHGPRPG